MRLCALSSTTSWTGVVSRSFWAAARLHRITYADILRDLEPLNEGRDAKDRITYDSLWIHAKRHYELAGIAAYWSARIYKDLRIALRDNGVQDLIDIAADKSHQHQVALGRVKK